MSALEENKQLREQYDKACKHLGGAIVKEALQPLWDAEPTLLAVSWTQYTPYFNDGEPGVFSVREICRSSREQRPGYSGLFEGDDPDAEDEDGQLWYEQENLWWSPNYSEPNERLERLYPALQYANKALQENKKVLETLFGDHTRVVAHRDGKVIANEYDHY